MAYQRIQQFPEHDASFLCSLSLLQLFQLIQKPMAEKPGKVEFLTAEQPLWGRFGLGAEDTL